MDLSIKGLDLFGKYKYIARNEWKFKPSKDC